MVFLFVLITHFLCKKGSVIQQEFEKGGRIQREGYEKVFFLKEIEAVQKEERESEGFLWV